MNATVGLVAVVGLGPIGVDMDIMVFGLNEFGPSRMFGPKNSFLSPQIDLNKQSSEVGFC